MAGRTDAVFVSGLIKRFATWREMLPLGHPSPARTALNGVSFNVYQGEVFGLLGPNGAGKTTLLKILATILLPDGGVAKMDGHDVVAEGQRVRQRVGYCLDSKRSFYQRLTGVQNLAFFATLNNIPPSRIAGRVAEVLGFVGLDGLAEARYGTYSDGMQQRLSLARALLTDPPVLLLDEPTKSLDPEAARHFRRFLRDVLAGGLGKTIVLVTHNLDEVRECCDRAAVMDGGRIVAEDTGAALCKLIEDSGFPSSHRITGRG
jgi:ABC-2 type transport system ATP-binding protein